MKLEVDKIFSSLPCYIYWTDVKGLLIGANSNFAKLVGLRDPGEISNKLISELPFFLNNPEAAAVVIKNNLAILDEQTSETIQENYPCGDQQFLTVVSKKSVLRDEQGKISGIISLSFETSKINYDAINAKNKNTAVVLDNILKNIPGHLYWKNSEGIYEGCNDPQAKSLGLESGLQIVGKSDFELPWGEGDAEKFRVNDLEIMRTGLPITYEETAIVNGKPGIVLSLKTPLLNEENAITGVLGISVDITSQKQAEAELKIAKEAAERYSVMQADFIENMQHDIRTPASGLAAVLATLPATEKDPARKELLLLLCKSADRLLEICNEVIDFDKIERDGSPIASQKLSIKHLISSVVDLNQAAAYRKKLKLSFNIAEDMPPVFRGDKHRISRVLINLVGNAIKFTDEGSITVSAKVLKLEAQEVIVQFEIQDTGVGIPKEKKAFMYEKFARGTPSNRGQYKGSGLGLQIVKKFVEDLKGEIDVHSEIGKGTTFYIAIPLEKPLIDEIYDEHDDEENLKVEAREEPQAAQTLQEASVLDAGTGANILLIEDEALAQMAATQVLRSADCQVTLAANMEQALRQLNQQVFDLVISDIGLPDGSGFDIVRAIKSNDQAINYATPFISLTAHSNTAKKEESARAGFMVMLQKPLVQDKLKALLDIYVNKQGQEAAAIGSPQVKVENDLIIDVQETIRLCDNHENLAWDLLGMLVDELQKEVPLIEAARRAGDVTYLRELFHKMEGGLSYCGVPRLRKASRVLHDAVKQLPLAELDDLFANFYKEADVFSQAQKKLKRV